MRFTLLEIAILYEQWWVSVCTFDGNYQPSLLHIERDIGHWKVDVFGLRALYFWWRDCREA